MKYVKNNEEINLKPSYMGKEINIPAKTEVSLTDEEAEFVVSIYGFLDIKDTPSVIKTTSSKIDEAIEIAESIAGKVKKSNTK